MKVDFATNMEVTSTYNNIETPKSREPDKVDSKPEAVKEKEPQSEGNERQKVQEAVDKINKQLKSADTKLQFRIHESSYSVINKISIKVIDETNDEVIREIPSEEAIELSERMHELTGILFDRKK